MANKHDYRHLDMGEPFTIEMNMRDLAEKVCSMNYGLHRFLSEVVDILEESKYERDKKLGNEIEKVVEMY